MMKNNCISNKQIKEQNGCPGCKASHGGDVYRNDVSLDFSVNLNPLGVPGSIRQAALTGLEEVTQYPDPFHFELRSAIAECEQTDPERIVCGSGASELIMASVHAFMPKTALMTAPCYSGYETALKAAGTEVREYPLDESLGFRLDEGALDQITDSTDMVFLTDPNNPNGSLIDDGLLIKIVKKCEECHAVLMIDECFLPLTDAGSSYYLRMQDRIHNRGTVLHLRAFTKTFAIPGIRIGYIVSDDTEALETIRMHLPEWNISRIAEKAGAAAARALSDHSYLNEAVCMISRERTYLTGELEALGIKVYPSDVNYLLFRSVPGLYEKLLGQGILIRRCANFHGLDDSCYRIAVRRHEENEILINTLKKCLSAEEYE